MVWRELDTGEKSAAFNMALDEVLLQAPAESPTSATLRFLSFNPSCVLVGYNQAVEQEVRSSYCRNQGIAINRRITGGGAVYFDPSQVGWELAGPRHSPLFPLRLEELYRKIGSAVAVALRKLGVSAQFKPRNDIEVRGKKISGMGGTEDRGSFLFQGTLLVKDEIKAMVKSLKIPVEKLSHKELGSLRERVTCLEQELGYIPKREEIKRAFRDGFSSVFGVEIRKGKLTPSEKKEIKKKLGFFSSAEWVGRVRYPLNRQGMLSTAYRCQGGVIRVAMMVNALEKVVRATYIAGDFFLEPKERLLDLERLLKNIPMRREFIFSQMREFFHKNSLEMLSITPKDFLSAVEDIFIKWENIEYGFTIGEANKMMVVGGDIEKVLREQPSYFLFPYCAKRPACPLRYNENCELCGKCEVGEGYRLALGRGLTPVTIINNEHLRQILRNFKSNGVAAYMGSCCEKFYTKHREEFEGASIPALLLDIESETCYDLGKVKDAYDGKFGNKTELNIPLIGKVLNFIGGVNG